MKFALPTVIAQIFMGIYSMVDGIFVSNVIGTDALSSVNIGMPYVMIVLAFGVMIGTGGNAIISVQLGEGKNKEAKENFTLLSIIYLIGCGIISALSILFRRHLLELLGANDLLMDYCMVPDAFTVLIPVYEPSKYMRKCLIMNNENMNPQNIRTKKKLPKAGKILIIVGCCVLALILAAVVFIAVLLTENPLSAKKKEFHDPSDYYKVFVDSYAKDTEEYKLTHDAPFDMLPEDPAGEITEFSYTYYNPWDAQELIALTVQYAKTDYEAELARLEEFGIGDFSGIYSVTGEAPDGYRIIAMVPDAYSGFSYALVPEKEDLSVTYVVINFCNYFLDIDIHDYFPEQYLLPGFDASENNPYRFGK